MEKFNRPYLIAEISGNHNGSLKKAKKLIRLAKNYGADCVKLQSYTPDSLTINVKNKYFMIKDGLWKNQYLYELYEESQTPLSWIKELFVYAKKTGIECFSTPFDKEGVDLLVKMNAPFIKISSFEMNDLDFVEYIAKKNKKIIISTGMANLNEINETVKLIRKYNKKNLIIMHCVSGYPSNTKDMNIETIKDLKERFNCTIGLSDHSMNDVSCIVAYAYGARVFEKHFIDSRKNKGPDSKFSLEPEELKNLKNNLELSKEAIGKVNYKIKESEKKNLVFRRSLFAIKDIKKGEFFSRENIKSIRPGYGLKPSHLKNIMNKKSLFRIKRGTPLKFKHFLSDA